MSDMSSNLNQLAAVAQCELAAKMQSIVALYSSKTINNELLASNEIWQRPSSSCDDERDRVQCMDTVGKNLSGASCKLRLEMSNLSNEGVSTNDCGSSDIGQASHTPSSRESSPHLSNEGSQADDVSVAVSSSTTPAEASIKDLLETYSNSSEHTSPSRLDDTSVIAKGISVETKQGVIATGARFSSFAEFEQAFDLWKQMFHHPFRVASSETLRHLDGTANETFKYRYIVYHCAHYGQPRMRGVGKRPNQNYLPCGCRAMLRLNFSWAENALRITTLNDQHTSHDLSADSYAKIASKIRKSSPGSTISERSPLPRRSKTQQLRGSQPPCSYSSESRPVTSPRSASTAPPIYSKAPFSMLAQNTADAAEKMDSDTDGITTTSQTQSVYDTNTNSQFPNRMQSLAAVAAAIHQQQQIAAAVFAQQKENMSFGGTNSTMIPPIGAMHPQLLPLLRNMLGLSNISTPFMMSSPSSYVPTSKLEQPTSPVVDSILPSMDIPSSTTSSSTTPSIVAPPSYSASLLEVQAYQQSQLSLLQQYQQQQISQMHMTSALQPTIRPSPAHYQMLSSAHLQAAALQSSLNPTAMTSGLMSSATMPTLQNSLPHAQTVGPIDLSNASSTLPNSTSRRTERLEEVSKVLQPLVVSLIHCNSDSEYARRITYLNSLQQFWQSCDPTTPLATSEPSTIEHSSHPQESSNDREGHFQPTSHTLLSLHASLNKFHSSKLKMETA